ncbi:MAG: hypothetical protein JXA36_00210 [Coriobacteriia bacterium]|nr:hypothetical protein [Coriobacteriia bacterium]
MKYSRFEVLALVLGAIAIVASIFMAPAVSPQAAEVAGQLLLIIVLAGALHWGRTGGFFAALMAIAIYVLMRIPLLQSQGLSTELITMLGSRTLTYAVIGIVGGEVASRIKYLFARLENDTLIDPVTRVYSARYAADAIISGVGQWERYQTDYSVVRLVIASRAFAALKESSALHLMRQVASHLRGDIRLVDDLAAEATGIFLALLPRTDAAGASVVADRLTAEIADLLSATPDVVSTTVLSAATDMQSLRRLAHSLGPTTSSTGDTSDETRSGRIPESRQDPVA